MNKKHNWNKIFKGPNGPKWNKVAPLLVKVLEQGTEKSEGRDQYIRTLVYKGHTVVVRFIKGADGAVKYIGTAWVK